MSFSQPGETQYDARCQLHKLVDADDRVATKVELKVRARKLADGTVLLHGDLSGKRVGKTYSAQVAANGDTAECPTVVNVDSDMNLKVGKPKSATIRLHVDPKVAIEVRVTAHE